jgi:tetratricopeptide (TPR) repeat protein
MNLHPNRGVTVRAVILVAAILSAGQTNTIAADPAAGWKGAKVMPKLGAEVKVDGETIDDSKEGFSVPWTVQEVKDELLLVGSYRKGWVEQSQVVTLDEAPAYYTQFVKTRPQQVWAYGMRAIALKEKGDLDSAIADYGQELRLAPTAGAYNNRGNALTSKKDYGKAIADYNQAIRLDPSCAFAYNNRGWVWFLKKEYDRAIADYGESVRLDPNYGEPLNNTAWLRATCSDARFRDGKDAVKLATEACKLAGWTDSGSVDTLGAAYAEAGDFDSAVKYQKKALELNPNDAEFVKGARQRLALYQGHKPYRED